MSSAGATSASTALWRSEMEFSDVVRTGNVSCWSYLCLDRPVTAFSDVVRTENVSCWSYLYLDRPVTARGGILRRSSNSECLVLELPLCRPLWDGQRRHSPTLFVLGMSRAGATPASVAPRDWKRHSVLFFRTDNICLSKLTLPRHHAPRSGTLSLTPIWQRLRCCSQRRCSSRPDFAVG